MLQKILAKGQSDGLSKTLAFLRRRVLRIQRHLLYGATCNSTEAPQWLPGEQVLLASRDKPWKPAISAQLLSGSRENKDYLQAILDGEAEALAVVREGRLVHYGFLMYRNRTTRLLGFGDGVGLIGNAFTVPDYRGRACQVRSVAARIQMAARAGVVQVISETAYDNTASQRNIVKGGMQLLGKIELIVVLNVLVIRYKRPDQSIPLLGLCPW